MAGLYGVRCTVSYREGDRTYTCTRVLLSRTMPYVRCTEVYETYDRTVSARRRQLTLSRRCSVLVPLRHLADVKRRRWAFARRRKHGHHAKARTKIALASGRNCAVRIENFCHRARKFKTSEPNLAIPHPRICLSAGASRKCHGNI